MRPQAHSGHTAGSTGLMANNKPVRHDMSGYGRLRIDWQLPFLAVYRRPSNTTDSGTDRLLPVCMEERVISQTRPDKQFYFVHEGKHWREQPKQADAFCSGHADPCTRFTGSVPMAADSGCLNAN